MFKTTVVLISEYFTNYTLEHWAGATSRTVERGNYWQMISRRFLTPGSTMGRPSIGLSISKWNFNIRHLGLSVTKLIVDLNDE